MGNLMIMPSGRGNPIYAQVRIMAYSGRYKVDGTGMIRFLTSGYVEFAEDATIDAFLVGGGASGYACATDTSGNGGNGGNAGKTATRRAIEVERGKKYQIVIGKGGEAGDAGYQDGGETWAFNTYANGGRTTDGGSGGGGFIPQQPGGAGGSDGEDGKGYYPGVGQHTTTRAFGEENGELFADGGAGGTSYGGDGFTSGGSAGGGSANPNEEMNGRENTGSGGGGASWYDEGGEMVHNNPGNGGSGIVIIRKAVS